MKKRIIIALLAGLSFTACTNSTSSLKPQTSYQKPTPQQMEAFRPTMTRVALSTREDPNYNKMTIRPEDKKWFSELMYRLWDRQITKIQFISEGSSRYPGHNYEFNFIANGFKKS